MSLSGVTDVAGNPIAAALTWSFVLQNYISGAATIQITGLKLLKTFSTAFTDPNNILTANLTRALATYLNVPPSQLQYVKFTMASDSNTFVSLTVAQPNMTRTREDRRSALDVANELKKLTSHLQNSLNTNIDPYLKSLVDPASNVCDLVIILSFR